MKDKTVVSVTNDHWKYCLADNNYGLYGTTIAMKYHFGGRICFEANHLKFVVTPEYPASKFTLNKSKALIVFESGIRDKLSSDFDLPDERSEPIDTIYLIVDIANNLVDITQKEKKPVNNDPTVKTWENKDKDKNMTIEFSVYGIPLLESDATPYTASIQVKYQPNKLCVCPLSVRDFVKHYSSIKMHHTRLIGKLEESIIESVKPKEMTINGNFQIETVDVEVVSNSKTAPYS